jgi:nitroimidazol reductase NimA-like FMN-containing flavoprotein (pyridoxamine 5'-phosphate oxidase superfamily)
VIPVNYVYRSGSIYGRTGSEGKLGFLKRENEEVAFQADE